MEADISWYLTKARKQHDPGALQLAYGLIKDACSAVRSAPQVYVECAEAALQLGFLEISRASLKMYFDGNPPANQFLCRAFLCRGRLETPPATGSVKDFEQAVLHFLKAIEISKSEPRYHFIVFNASVLYLQTARPLLQPGRCRHLVPSLQQVVQSLEEVADQDYSWRAELMMHLITCLVDSEKMDDAESFARDTENFINSHIPHLYPRLYTLLVRHKLTESDAFKKLEELNEEEPKEELEQILHLLVEHTKVSSTPVSSVPPQSPTHIPPADRVALLLELALLALQEKHQKVAANCLEELKSAEEASVGQRIIMECVSCELNLLKRDVKMNDYSKASVEARLKEIDKLDQWLQTAVKEGDAQAMQTVCAMQWSFCLPLLQRNFRRHIKTPLLNVAHVLEDMQSMLLEMRSQVHSELAVIEEEEGRLESSLTHLQKAMLLDNGTQRERLSSAARRLQLRGTLYEAPARIEDKAFMLMHQVSDLQPQRKTDIRPILVSVGLLLAPDDFQIVVDADDASGSCVGSGPVAHLSAIAQHHSASVCKVDGHLARQGDGADSTERVKLWATLAKTARKREAWDVCRAACRFCLLYDDGRWKTSETEDDDRCGCKEEKSSAECLHHRSERSQTCVKDLLRLLAEIHFISAEATVQKLLTEGAQLNRPVVLAVVGEEHVSEEDPHWAVYRDWIQALSSYATSSFLRAAELGAEIREPWVVENAAIYLWNYSSQLLAAGEYQCLLPTFQTLMEMLRNTEYIGHHALFVLLCDTVARGLIQLLTGPDQDEPNLQADIRRNRTEKGMQALELCEYALRLSNCNCREKSVPIAVRKRVVATWVKTKGLLQQQVGQELDTKDECENEGVAAMTRVLVGVEMLRCNLNPRHMEFSVPGLSALVDMASECSWPDAMVELQVWCQLATFCPRASDHSLLLLCTENVLKLKDAAVKSLSNMPCVLYGPSAVNELLSTATCLRGLSLVHEANGDLHSYREAMKMLLSSISYAEKAENPALCLAAARQCWNSCQPLTQTPEERLWLREPLEKILIALVQSRPKQAHTKSKVQGSPTLTALRRGSSTQEATDEQELSLKAAIYSLLAHICIDKADWKGALRLLDQAMRDTPYTKHHLPLLRQKILLKAQLGENVTADIQKLRDKGEQYCSFMWHQVALCTGSRAQQFTCYQKAITSLQSAETQWQKMGLLLEFGEWLYCHNFPKPDVRLQVERAVDVLLQMETERADGAEDGSKTRDVGSLKAKPLVGVQGSLFAQTLSDITEVRRLDALVRAHTLLAVMADRASPEHQLNLLRAYMFVLRIWQVSMTVCSQISSESTEPPPSAGCKKGKGKKAKGQTPAEERPQSVVLDQAPPSTQDWASYASPELARQIFRTTTDPCCLNTGSITKQTQSLFYLNLLQKELQSLSLGHLTLPILHLAEAIAGDLLDSRGLSDLYRLRIVRTCCQLGLETCSPYQEKFPSLCEVNEQEQMECHKAFRFSRQRSQAYNQPVYVEEKAGSGRQSVDVSAQHIWLDKAEICVSMGLYQPARQLLAEAHLVSLELGDQKGMARCLLILATLACDEQNYAQALIFLDKAQATGGDMEFWYQLTLAKVRVVVGQGDRDRHTEVDRIIKQGCEALKLALEQRVNRVPEITFFITSLEMRGAIERIRALGGGEPGKTLSTDSVQRLMDACKTLRECASGFTKLSYSEHAAEARVEYAHCLRILAKQTTEDKRRFLLDGLSQLQLAVTEQEHVVLSVQRLIPSQEKCHGLSLAAMRRLLRLRVALAEFSLAVLEERCAEEKRQALARKTKTSAEIALEEFTRCPPEPGSLDEEWTNVGRTLGQVAQGQLAAVSSHSLDDMETRACCLSLMGKYFRLLAVQEDPVYQCALWDRDKQASCDPKAASAEEENSQREKERGSSRREPRATSARPGDLQRRRCRAQQLLAQASEALAEAVSLCLQHKLPSSILADASLNMLECHGQSDPALAGQHLALFQSCCTAATMAEVLSSACAATSVSQLSALLSLHKKLLLSQEDWPSGMLKGVEDSLNRLFKAFSHVTVCPSHLQILAALPSNLKILLLQHSKDGSELYGAFYEMIRPQNPKWKAAHDTGTLACSRVAKVSVCPQALLALREQARAFGQETRHALLKEAGWHGAEDGLESFEEHQDFPTESTTEETLESHFRNVVRNMEDYLNPLLTQLDLSFTRPQDASLPVPALTKAKDKDEKGSSAKSPVEAGEYVVLLADRKLLELPLEALSILQDEGLRSVSRDFSLQLLHSRLSTDDPENVESDNKKETKGGKGTKGKGDQSRGIKGTSANSDAFTVNTRHFKYIVDSNNEGSFERTSLSATVEEILEKHSKHFTQLWKGKRAPSLPEMEQLLCTCSGFCYLGMKCFMAKIPPAKLASLNLSECRVALLFDLVWNKTNAFYQSSFDKHKSERQKPLEAALLLSLAGVDCIFLNQWHSSVQQITHNTASVLDNLLRVKQTSGQAIHALRRQDSSDTPQHKVTGADGVAASLPLMLLLQRG